MLIEDGKGSGRQAEVDGKHRLQTAAKSRTIQHVVSEEDEQAYQCACTATAAVGTVTCLHLQNNSATRNVVVSFIRLQNITLAGGTAVPNVLNYFTIALGRTYVSGGASATPVNVSSGSSNIADVTVYNSGPTLTGTALEIDRWYPASDGDEQTFNKEGAVIIPAGQTMEISFVGDHTSGTLYSRLSFIMDDKDF
jgi:hypothetical protein